MDFPDKLSSHSSYHSNCDLDMLVVGWYSSCVLIWLRIHRTQYIGTNWSMLTNPRVLRMNTSKIRN